MTSRISDRKTCGGISESQPHFPGFVLVTMWLPWLRNFCEKTYFKCYFLIQLMKEVTNLYAWSSQYWVLILPDYIPAFMFHFQNIVRHYLQNKTAVTIKAFQFRKHDFDLWVRGDGLDMYQQFWGGFESMRAILPIWASEASEQ